MRTRRVIAFHQGLRQLGYIEGENVVVDYRWALGEYERLPAFAAELVKRRVSVLVATGGEPAALAAKSATSTIPIVFAIGGDPIKLGLVASYNRPGGNATGANILAAEMDGKRLGLLHELMPNATRVGVLLNPNFPAYTEQLNDLQQAAKIINLQVEIRGAMQPGSPILNPRWEANGCRRSKKLHPAWSAWVLYSTRQHPPMLDFSGPRRPRQYLLRQKSTHSAYTR